MVAGGIDSGRQASSESLNSYCDVFPISTDHRQVEDGDLNGCRVATDCSAISVQAVDLGLKHGLVRWQIAAVGLLGDDPQRAPLSGTSDNDRHIAHRTGIAGGLGKMHITAVVSLGTWCPKGSQCLDANRKLIKSFPVAGKVQAVRLVLP